LKNKVKFFEMTDIKIVYRDINELNEAEYNPRKINAKQKEQMIKSIREFGFVDPIIININPERKNIIIGGHQRVRAAKAIGYEKIPAIELDLSFEQEKELNLRLNKNGGEFDNDLLNEYFERQFLLNIGFDEKELGKLQDEFDDKFNSITNDKAEMPITQKFNESYNAVIIFSDNELDFNWIRNVLELDTAKDYKTSNTGLNQVITVKQFQGIWKKAQKKKD